MKWLSPIALRFLVVCLSAVFCRARGDERSPASPTPAAAISDEGVLYFEQRIRPLLVAHCYSCHSRQQSKSEGSLLLDSRQGWMNGGDRGPAVIPGDPDGSLLIQSVRHTHADLQMPPDKKISGAELSYLEQWVRIGAPDPRDEQDQVRPGSYNPSDPLIGRQHWAFQPLIETQLPDVRSADWPRSPIDHFVLAELDARDLQPAPDAARRTLARRLYFQLTGLPPTPEQLTAFLNDDRPDAYEQLVDELLSSSHFGERWGRHWLDLARYADSNGLDENFLFREAWRYRNWVIDAVNADLSFDQFLMQQIAGDLLPWDSIEQRDRQRIAAGFMVIGPKVLLGNDASERLLDVADEQLTTIGRAVLGQTLGCARCHDHKFDPVPTADYYALAGILTSTQVLEQRYMLGQQRLMEQLVGLGEDGDQLDSAYEAYWRELPALKERQQRAKSALKMLEDADEKAFAALAKKHADAVADGVADSGLTREERVTAQQAFVATLEQAIANPPKIPARAMIPNDVASPADDYIRLAGRFDQKGDQVSRGFLQVLDSRREPIPTAQSGRMELAKWLTDIEQGAGHVAARVTANRVWHHLIGRGLVRTVDNFGRTGEYPSHPELLDYLAGQLIDSGWSVKSLVRQIVLSRTFAMSSDFSESGYAMDPENRLLWRGHRRRLDPESLRDAMLSAAGRLDLQPMQSTVWYLGDQATAVGANTNRRRTDFPCRSVYLPVIRNDLPELFDVFNFADPHSGTGMRPSTMVATQGLFLLNDPSVMDAAQATAEKLLANASAEDPDQLAAALFELLVGDPGADHERAALIGYVQDAEQRLRESGDESPRLHAWAMACHGLFASSRFQMLE